MLFSKTTTSVRRLVFEGNIFRLAWLLATRECIRKEVNYPAFPVHGTLSSRVHLRHRGYFRVKRIEWLRRKSRIILMHHSLQIFFVLFGDDGDPDMPVN